MTHNQTCVTILATKYWKGVFNYAKEKNTKRILYISSSEVYGNKPGDQPFKEGEYGFIGITKKDGKLKLIVAEHKIPYTPWSMGVYDDEEPIITTEKEIDSSIIKLKATFCLEHNKENVQFSYFDNNTGNYVDFGAPVKLRYTLDQFVGVRFAWFCYSTKKTGGSATFKDFYLELL